MRDFSLLLSLETGSEAHPVCSVGTGGKGDGPWIWPVISISAKVKSVWSCVPIPPVCLHGAYFSTGTTVCLCWFKECYPHYNVILQPLELSKFIVTVLLNEQATIHLESTIPPPPRTLLLMLFVTWVCPVSKCFIILVNLPMKCMKIT